MKTIRVKPWGEEQGGHVVINEVDFDPDFHQHLDSEAPEADKPKRGRPAKADPAPEAE